MGLGSKHGFHESRRSTKDLSLSTRALWHGHQNLEPSLYGYELDLNGPKPSIGDLGTDTGIKVTGPAFMNLGRGIGSRASVLGL